MFLNGERYMRLRSMSSLKYERKKSLGTVPLIIMIVRTDDY